MNETSSRDYLVQAWKVVAPAMVKAYSEERCATFFADHMWKLCCWIFLENKDHAKFCSSYLALGLKPPQRIPRRRHEFSHVKVNRALIREETRKRNEDEKESARFQMQVRMLKRKQQYYRTNALSRNAGDTDMVSDEGGPKSVLQRLFQGISRRRDDDIVLPDDVLKTTSRLVIKIDLGLTSLSFGCSAMYFVSDCCKCISFSFRYMKFFHTVIIDSDSSTFFMSLNWYIVLMRCS